MSEKKENKLNDYLQAYDNLKRYKYYLFTLLPNPESSEQYKAVNAILKKIKQIERLSNIIRPELYYEKLE